MADEDKTQDHWTVDKRVPIALVVTLIVQFCTGIWWLAGVNKDVLSLRENIITQQVAWKEEIRGIKDVLKEFGGSRERVSALEGEMKAIRESLLRVERNIEKLSWNYTENPGRNRR